MAKIEITRTELVWPGKYNEDGTLKEVLRVSAIALRQANASKQDGAVRRGQ